MTKTRRSHSTRRSHQDRFDFAVEPSKRRSKNGKKIGRPKDPRAGVSHTKRESIDALHPIHVTLRLARKLPSLRYAPAARVVECALADANGRHGLRVLEYSLQVDHAHLLVEIDREHAEVRREGGRSVRDVRRALGRAMKGLLVRIARRLNRFWGRTGRVFGDRYHTHVLRTPREVRHARIYVRRNGQKHGKLEAGVTVDPFSSDRFTEAQRRTSECLPIRLARTWLAAVGWRGRAASILHA